MPTNNFKLFDEKKANMMSDDDYAINQQRLNGVQSGVASSQLQNKTLYQTALMCYALAQLMAANGYDANDANAVSTFVNNLSSTMVQKVKDRASELEVKTGANVNKYITPGDFLTSLNYLTKAKYGENDPTTSTEGTLGQIYVNVNTQRAFYCGKIEGNTFTWHPIARIKVETITKIFTSNETWLIPANITELMVLCVGAGGRLVNNGGGGSGYFKKEIVNVSGVQSVDVVIGKGTATSIDERKTSFGTLLSADGGNDGSSSHGGNGYAGGGGGARSYAKCSGGNGTVGGGGGGGVYYGTQNASGDGGDGGEFGGGGGGGYARSGSSIFGTGGSGGTHGGNGGDAGSDGSNGTNTIGMGLEFEGAGKGGSAGSYGSDRYGGGGGGGYGGNGGNGGTRSSGSVSVNGSGGGGGGGYGGNGGNGSSVVSNNSIAYSAGGGGGGYGGNGFDGDGVNGGGGGGYGRDNYGAGGGNNTSNSSGDPKNGSDGICIVTYESVSVY